MTRYKFSKKIVFLLFFTFIKLNSMYVDPNGLKNFFKNSKLDQFDNFSVFLKNQQKYPLNISASIFNFFIKNFNLILLNEIEDSNKWINYNDAQAFKQDLFLEDSLELLNNIYEDNFEDLNMQENLISKSIFDNLEVLEKYQFHYAKKVEIDDLDEAIFIGDIHGNIDVLIKLIKGLIDKKVLNDYMQIQNNKKIFFMGDFVDRGLYGLEVLFLIMFLKILNPENIFILKGNHESACMNYCYDFFQELKSKIMPEYLYECYSNIVAIFNILPEVIYLKIKNKIYQINHAGFNFNYNPSDLLNGDYEFELTGPTLLDKKNYISPFLWWDINPYYTQGRIEDVRGCAKCVSSIDGLNYMDKNKINGKLGGHKHDLFTNFTSKNYEIVLKDKQQQDDILSDNIFLPLGLCDIGRDGTPIFIHIAGEILGSGIYYDPSYLSLKIIDGEPKFSLFVC